MNPETQKNLLAALEKLFKSAKPAPTLESGMVRGSVRITEKTQSQKLEKTVAQSAGKEASPQAKSEKPAEADQVRKAFIEAGIEGGTLPTTAEKMSILLSESLQKNIIIEDPKLQGLMSRLQGGEGKLLNWDEPSEQTWKVADSILRTRITPPLGGSDQLIFDELRQAAGEYYYHHKLFFEKNGIYIKEKPDDTFYDGIRGRMVEDEEIIASKRVAESVKSTQKDPFEHINEIDAQVKNLEWPEEIPADQAMRDIANYATGPENEWISRAAAGLKENTQALSFLADLAKKDPNLLKDPDFVFMKGVQFQRHMTSLASQTGEGSNERLQEAHKVIDAMRERFLEVGKGSELLKAYETISKEPNPDVFLSLGAEAGATPPTNNLEYNPALEANPIPPGAQHQALRDLVADYNSGIQPLLTRLTAANGLPATDPNRQRIIIAAEDELNKRVINMLVTGIDGIPVNQLPLIENLHIRLEHYRQELVKIYNEQGRGYNSLYVPEDKTREYQLNPLLQIRIEQDRYVRARKLLPTQLQEAGDQTQRMSIAYLRSEQYRRDVMDLFRKGNEINFPDIEYHSGIHVDRANPESHPWFQRMKNDNQYDAFLLRMGNALAFPDLLNKNYTSWQAGNLEQIGVGMAGLGEPGIMAILNNRGINVDSFDVLEAMYGNITGPNGEEIVGSGPAQEWFIDRAVDYLYAHKNLIEPKFRDEYGPNVTLTKADVKASVEEVQMLFTLTGERAKALRRLLTQYEGQGQGINPAAFAGEGSGDNKMNQAIEPERQFFIRWQVASEVQKVWMENNAKQKAWQYGIADKLKEQINHANRAQLEKLVRKAFIIQNDNAEHIKNQLSVIKYDEGGHKIDFGPEKIEDVTKEQLLRWMIIRDGTQLADLGITGGYTYFEVGWNATEQMRTYNEMFVGDRGIGALERLRLEAGGMFDITKDHHALAHAQEHLRLRDDHHREHEGALANAARYMPSYILRAMYYEDNPLAETFVQAHFNGYNVFHDRMGGLNVLTNDMEGAVSVNRPDLFFRRYELTLTTINRGLADWENRDPNNPLMKLDRFHPDRLNAKGLPSVDWSRAHQVGGSWTIVDTHLPANDPTRMLQERQMQVIEARCNELGVTPQDFIRISKELSDFTLRDDVLKEASHPIIARKFFDVRKKDARLGRLDDVKEMWADLPAPVAGAPPDATATYEYIRHQYIGRWSSRIANLEGFGISGGMPRWIGDHNNTRSVLISDLIPISKSRNMKILEQHLEKYVDTVVNTGGDNTRMDASYTLTMSNILGNRMDFFADLRGQKDEDTARELSTNQRVGGKGFQAYTQNDTDHVLHLGEAIAGEKFHDKLPHLAHVTDANSRVTLPIAKWPGFVNKFGDKLGEVLPDRITIGGKSFRINLGKRAARFFNGEIRVKTVWVYRIIAFLGLGALLGLFETGESLKKGVSDATGGGGGGGGGGGHH